MTHDRHRGLTGHILGMLVAGAAVLLVLLAAGRSVGEAVPLAAALACPLMMIGMIFMLGRDRSHDAAPCHHSSRRAPEPAGPAVDARPDRSAPDQPPGSSRPAAGRSGLRVSVAVTGPAGLPRRGARR
jgi:hypothetical protein